MVLLDGIPSQSFRGISGHKFTSPFKDPGKQDLTADVDFGCIKDTALSIPGARVSGPVLSRGLVTWNGNGISSGSND